MTDILMLTVTREGHTLVAVWPTWECTVCHREAALGVVTLGAQEPRRNSFRCSECEGVE